MQTFFQNMNSDLPPVGVPAQLLVCALRGWRDHSARSDVCGNYRHCADIGKTELVRILAALHERPRRLVVSRGSRPCRRQPTRGARKLQQPHKDGGRVGL